MPTIEDLKRVAEVEFADIVKNAFFIGFKLRIILRDDSFLDVNVSRRLPDKFGFHWECGDRENSVYRYDNFPDKNWEGLSTFPYHFHSGRHDNVKANPFPTAVIDGFRSFMEFVGRKIE